MESSVIGDAASFSVARSRCLGRDSGLYLLAHLLPAKKRNAMWATWSFFDLIREAIDPPGTVGDSSCCDGVSQRLEMVRDRINAIYGGQIRGSSPAGDDERVLDAFATSIGRYEIPRKHLLNFAEGIALEAGTARYATWEALQRHCRQTAGEAALAVAAIIGVTHSDAGDQIVQLAVAMRLVQLLSSIGSDFKRGRVYVPQEDLARFRYSERKIAAATIDESFERLLAFESQRAGAILQSSSALIPWIAEPGGRIAATALMLHTVARLRRIIIRSAAAFAASPRHTMLDTLRLLPTAWRVSRRAAAGELPRLLRAATDSTMARCP